MASNSSANREIVTTRVIKASPEQVFKAWTHPHYLAQWWGPKDFKNTFNEYDLRPDGSWDFVMHGPNGTDYPNKSTFVEIKPPAKLVFNHVSKPHFQVIATFEEDGSSTKVTFRQVFSSAEECEKIRKFAGEANEQNIDRLEAVVAEMILDRSNREVNATRMFDTSMEEVYAAWTDSKSLAQWWGPAGSTILTHSIELKPQGIWRFMMYGPDGSNQANRIEFTEVVKPSFLAFMHGTEEMPDQYRTFAHFERQGEETKISLKMLFPNPEALMAARKSGLADSARQILERLAGFLSKNKKG